MDKFIIELRTKINGKWEKGFHQDLKNNDNKYATNVYCHHTTSDKSKAKRFFDKDEADRFAVLFTRENLEAAQVIPVKR